MRRTEQDDPDVRPTAPRRPAGRAAEALDLFAPLEPRAHAPPPVAPEVAPFERGMQRSAESAEGWTPEERAELERAIRRLARERATFTADDVWAAAPAVPVRKGLAALLRAAQRDGAIAPTGRYMVAGRGGKHDHAQRLTVWEARL